MISLPQIFGFDIDGTLLRSDGSLSKRVCSSIRAVTENGSTVVLSTGRPWSQVRHIADKLGVVEFSVCLNGATIHACDGSLLRQNSMNQEQALAALEVARKLIPGVALGADMPDGSHIWETDFTHDFPADFDVDALVIPDASRFIAGPVLTWLLDCKNMKPSLAIELLDKSLPPGLEIRPSGLETPEIAVKGVSKASGLATVAEMQDIPASAACVFGDGLNDLAMFQWAGESIAMGNSHPQILSLANRVAPTNDEDGVAIVLEGLLERFS